MYKELSQYVAALEAAGELVRVRVPVDPCLEIAELTDRESKRPGGGRALLFEQTGTDFSVLTNLMGSDRRIAMALGVDSLDELTQRIAALFDELTTPKKDFLDKLRMLPLLAEMSRWLPRERSGRGACQQVVWQGEDASLDRLPVLQCWPHDGGRFVTLPLVHTLDPETGMRNVGMYRMQLFGAQQGGMHWHLHKTGERHYRAYQRLGRRMPVTVCLGGDPAYTYAATAPMPDNMDEYLLAGFLRRRPVELVRCLTNELMVPSDCDFVIEGYVDPSEEKVVEGPFGDHTGFYSLEDRYPLFHVTAITMRRGAIYPATIVGVPPQEDAYIAKATEKIFLAPIRAAMLPEVRDLYMPEAGVAHNIAVVNIAAAYGGQGLKAASSLWGAGQMMFNKFMVVASSSASVRDELTLGELARRIRIPQDLLFSRGPLDVLDHAAPEMGLGGKLLFDATGVDVQSEEVPIQLPHQFVLPDSVAWVDVASAVRWNALWIGVSASSVQGSVQQLAEQMIPGLLADNEVKGMRYMILMDAAAESLTEREKLWIASSNCDPSRDVVVRGEWIVFDARSKCRGVNGFARRWPNVVTASEKTIAQVDGRWKSYELGAFVPSPSLRYRSLVHDDAAAVGEKHPCE